MAFESAQELPAERPPPPLAPWPRASVPPPPLPLPPLLLRVRLLVGRGDGISKYRLAVRTGYGLTDKYELSFDPTKEEWSDSLLHFADFKPTWAGANRFSPPLQPVEIREVAVIVERPADSGFTPAAGGKGNFTLNFLSLRAYGCRCPDGYPAKTCKAWPPPSSPPESARGQPAKTQAVAASMGASMGAGMLAAGVTLGWLAGRYKTLGRLSTRPCPKGKGTS